MKFEPAESMKQLCAIFGVPYEWYESNGHKIKSMRPDNFDIDVLIDALQGTADTIEQHLPEDMTEDDLTREDYDAIDSRIWRCSCCDWWVEVCELAEDSDQCTDCIENP